MPKQTKSRRVTITPPVSLIIRPDETETATYGTPAYVLDEHHGAIFHHNTRATDYALLGIAPADPNPVLRIVLASDTYDEPETMLYDATDPAPSTGTPTEPDIAASGETIETPLGDRAVARMLAAKAVAAFYSGISLPFKSAHDLKRKAPINFALRREPSARSAALLAAILTYCNVQPGTLEFVRGSGAVPRKLLGYTDRPDETSPAGPESGGLSNCIPDRIEFVSGAISGAGCENATFRINAPGALANLRAFNEKQSDGEHLFSGAIALLELLAQPVTPTEPAISTSDAAPE